MDKIDLKKEYKYLYYPPGKNVESVDVPDMRFIMIDGAIEKGMSPGNSPVFQEAMQALYGAAYTLKFAIKNRKENPIDYPVMALEGLWWVEDGVFDIKRPDNWKFTLMIMQPNIVIQAIFSEGIDLLKKKKGDLPVFSQLRLENFKEGLAVQVLHIGPYLTEPESLKRMNVFMQENHLQDQVGLGGKHHEIYLGDPRRGDPAKLKTVLRHPVKKAG